MTMGGWARHHARSILFLMALLAVAGAVCIFSLPVGLFPQVSFPRVRISLDAGDRPAQRMVVEVTRPVEQAVRAIPGVRVVHSTTSRGSAEIDVDFDWGHDMAAAALQLESQINKMLPSLPAGTAFDVRRMNPTVYPIIAYSLSSDSIPSTKLRDLALYQLRPSLATINGVAQVTVMGDAEEEYRVEVDPGKLRAFGLTISDVAQKLSAANVLTASGRLRDHDKLYLVVTDTRFTSLDQLQQTVLRSGSQGVVLLDEVADIKHDTAPRYTRVIADGHDAVLLDVFQQPGGNTVRIAGDIKTRLATLRKDLPPGVHIANWYDQSGLILSSAASVRDAIIIGIVLAAIVLLVFLRNWKITLIAVIAVPASLAITVLLLYALNMSFNMMTLGGMAAAVGLIIDDAVVITEHIIRRLHGQRTAADRAGEAAEPGHPQAGPIVTRAADEFTRPLMGSSLSTIIIFLPLAFLSGVTGAFFKALSLTMASGLIISFFIAWLAVPILASHWLGPKDLKEHKEGFLGRWSSRIYGGGMKTLLAHSWFVLILIIPIFIVGVLAYRHVPSGFMPAMDEGGFVLDYNAPPGTSVEETDRLLHQVGDILHKDPAVQTWSRRTGLQMGGGITETNQGDFFIRLKPFPRPPIEEVMSRIRRQVQQNVPGLQIDTAQLLEDLIGDLTGAPQPIQIKLFGPDSDQLLNLAPQVANAISNIPGVVEVQDGIIPAGDALDVRVDRAKASLEGVDPDTVSTLIDNELSGQIATTLQQGPRLIGVRVWGPPSQRTTQRDVANLMLRAPDGHLFPLKRIATLDRINGQPQITRQDLRPMIPVTGRIEGRDLGSTIRDVKTALNKPGLIPQGVSYELGGLYQQQRIAFHGLLEVMLAALVLVFLLLLFLYEHIRVAIAMLVIMLLAIACVLIGLWITGTELNITSIMGMTMIVGIVTEASIFLYSEYEEQTLGGASPALLDASIHRARAILMTTIAAILALLPLALGIGQGAAMLQPLAIAIIAGLIAQLPLVLIILPALLRLLRSAR